MRGTRVRVALVPPAPGSLPAHACGVAIDVLRATTTLAVARSHGAGRIVPFAHPAEALAYRDAHPGTLACGERDGRIVPGFDLGNSPFEFTRERVEGRTLAFASTNGSRAMLAASRCRSRRIASFATLSSTLAALAGETLIVLVCAGKLGHLALEDAACAGTLAARLAAAGATLDGAGARLAATFACRDAADVQALVEGTEHARWLSSLGDAFTADVAFCARLDTREDAGEAPNAAGLPRS